MKPTADHLAELAYRCETSTDWLLGRDVRGHMVGITEREVAWFFLAAGVLVAVAALQRPHPIDSQ